MCCLHMSALREEAVGGKGCTEGEQDSDFCPFPGTLPRTRLCIFPLSASSVGFQLPGAWPCAEQVVLPPSREQPHTT